MSRLLASRRGNPRFAGFFLHVRELLLGVVQRLLLGSNLFLVLALFLGIFGVVAQTRAHVSGVDGGMDLALALQYIELTFQSRHFVFLLSDFSRPLIGGFLVLFGRGSGSLVFVGVVRICLISVRLVLVGRLGR